MTPPQGLSALGLVRWVFGDLELGTDTDMKVLFQQKPMLARHEEAIAPDAPVEFATPYGGFMGEMAGPFRGPEGLRQGWSEWTAAWESWSFRATDWLEVGEGRVLLLGDSRGRLAGSGLEIEAHVAALYTIEEDKIVRIEHFLDQDQARRAAGLE